MNYEKAYDFLDSVTYVTDNQVELLIADIQRMRLCQRESENKKFYDFRERAQARLKRINEEKNLYQNACQDVLIMPNQSF